MGGEIIMKFVWCSIRYSDGGQGSKLHMDEKIKDRL